MSDTSVPDDDRLLAIIATFDDLDGALPDGFAKEVFRGAREFGQVDKAYADLVEESTLTMRGDAAPQAREFKFGDNDLTAEGELGPDTQILGSVSPEGPATVRICTMTDSIEDDADPLGRFVFDVPGRVVRIVVTRGEKKIESDWYLR